MAITKNIVDMMGGTIKVESELGKGTEFIVSLRFRTAKNPVKHLPVPELSGLRALVADDDLHTCTSVAKMLTQIGMRADWTMYGRGPRPLPRARARGLPLRQRRAVRRRRSGDPPVH